MHQVWLACVQNVFKRGRQSHCAYAQRMDFLRLDGVRARDGQCARVSGLVNVYSTGGFYGREGGMRVKSVLWE